MAQVRSRHLCPKMRLSFALCFEGRFSEELRSAGATVEFLGECRIRNPLSLRRARGNLKRLLSTREIDLCVVHSSWSQYVFGSVVVRRGVPLVFWLHGSIGHKHWLQRLASMNLPALVLCNSEFTAGSLREAYPGVKAEVIYNPLVTTPTCLPDSDRAALRDALGIAREAVIIIQVSRMEEWKGHSLHLAALAKLKEIPNWVCLQVGGSQRHREVQYMRGLKQEAARLGIADRVKFLGERSDVSDLLAASDIHCQPNTGPEPFGNTFIEALCAGLPIVTTGMGGALEIVNDSCGILVPVNNPGALASALGSLIEDPGLRSSLGAFGFARAQEISGVAKQMGKLVEVLQGLVTPHPDPVSMSY
jgi:glycosyltransferase involved in cell wall biosynthesis